MSGMTRKHVLNRFCMAAVISSAALFAAGCRGDGEEAETVSTGTGETASTSTEARGPEISVTGCLTANLEGTSYALTPSDTATSAADRAIQMPGRETITYELVGNPEDFRGHANMVVTARGREDASVRRDADIERTDEAEQRPAPGSTDTPSVETTEEVGVNVRRLDVVTVVASGENCPSVGGQDNPSTAPPTRQP